MKDNIIRISIIKSFEYYISSQKHAIFLERWSLNGKELYCIGSVYFLNSNWGIEHNLPSARIYTRSEFSLKDTAENNYNDQILALKNLPHIEGITEYKDIKTIVENIIFLMQKRIFIKIHMDELILYMNNLNTH